MRIILKTGMVVAVLSLSFIIATPAKAFYIEIPRIVKTVWQQLHSGTSLAQEDSASLTPTNPTPTTPPATTETQPAPAPAPEITQPNPNPEPTQSVPAPQPMDLNQPNQPAQSCQVNGENMPGSCDQYNNQGNNNQGYNNEGNNNQGQFGNGDMNQKNEQQNQQNQQNQERHLKDVKRGGRQMQSQLKRLIAMLKNNIPDEIKTKLDAAKEMVNKLMSATTEEEIQDIDMGELQDNLQELEQTRQDIERVRQVKQQLRGTERGLTMFEQQIKRLTRQKITVPEDVTTLIAQIKTKLAAIKSANTWDEMDAAGVNDLQDDMQSLSENQQKLEMLARWPQTLKQMDQTLRDLNRALKSGKTIVTRLSRSGIDLSSVIARFQEKIDKLKTIRDQAVAQMQTGDSEDVFNSVQDDFFGQMDDVWQEQRIIQTMSNLGRFTSEFKRGLADAQRQVRALKQKRLDTSQLEDLVAQTKAKGDELTALVRGNQSEIDEDAIMGGLEELENLRNEFTSQVEELTGASPNMPWQQGTKQFKQVEMPRGFDQMIQRPSEQINQTQQSPQQGGGGGGMVGESNPQPSP